MNKSRKIMLRLVPVFLVLTLICVSTTNVFAISPSIPAGGTANTSITTFVGDIWQTVATVIQVLAIAAIIIAGLRYMFASADEKANIQKQTITLIVGAILVFAAVPVAKLVGGLANSVLNI